MTDLEIVIHEVVIEHNGKKKSVFLEEVLNQDNTPIRDFHVRGALGNYIWVKTTDRVVAQKAIDEFLGKGRYTVKSIKGAREAKSTNVRATETRRGQSQQRMKARILNSN